MEFLGTPLLLYNGYFQQLAQALISNELTEASNKAVLDELEEARGAISRLSAHHARSLGWESRLMTLSQEKDDIQ
jgi:hypothetical protein